MVVTPSFHPRPRIEANSGIQAFASTCVYREPHSIEEEGESRKLIG
jgi:hypothetical protein